MIKTEIFSEYNQNMLQSLINDFITENGIYRKNLIDIKFATAIKQESEDELYSALIIYDLKGK